ncbi:histidinol dehydrogenase [Trebonia sp.]|uniref:histidinol dehydrogenase n=1 Tax=Trebonia sp. TaxID=2767075 RepID=UPI002639B9CD|nr:histidinol dehydrogenase [Trebonia sp.]
MPGPFTGRLLRPGDEGFGDAAVGRIFNKRRPSRRPAAVLCAADAADVAAGVRLAREEGLRVAVRSGGHSWASWSLRDNTLLIDLAAFTGLSYDEETGIVTAGPAVRGGSDLDPFLAAQDRFFAGGHCPTVGIGGFLLQGGMGWNCRGWGWAAESIAAAEVVTAGGEILWCDEADNADLFWAARGGGPGFFGVVTAFRLRTRPRYRELTQTTYVYPASVAAEVLAWLHAARHDVPRSVELVAVGITPPLPPELDGGGPALVVDGVTFDGGPAALAALDTCPVAGKALVRKIGQPVTISELRAEQLRANPEGHRYFVDNAYLAGDPGSLIPALTPAFTGLPTAKSFSLWFDLAGRPASPEPGRPMPDMALSLQTDIYFATYVVCESPASDPHCRSWVDDTMRRLRPFAAGCYLGDSDFTVRPDRFMSDAAWQRFGQIRAARDPGRLFAGYDIADESALNRPAGAIDRDRPIPTDPGRGVLPAMSKAYLKKAVPAAQVAAGLAEVKETVGAVIGDIRERGDEALREYSAKFDNWSPESFRLSAAQIEDVVAAVPEQVITDIQFAQSQVRRFARAQLASMTEIEVETLPGVFLGHKHLPVRSAGAYIPGGRYPLTASAHMTVLTAKVAGVERVAACTPPIRGEIPAATVAAAHLAGADEIYLLGGVQAVTALALGTQTIGKVDLLAGPGNAYVAEAKRQLFGEVGIDLLAGPTEILVIADGDADPRTVAVDLLSQAEHGPDSPAILVTTSRSLGETVLAYIEKILPGMPTVDFAGPAWRDHGQVIVTTDIDEAFAVADSFACEHVEVLTASPRDALEKMRSYGALFLGEGTCVSYGDKVIGTNHVLPTRGAARYTGGLWVGKYLKTVTYQEVRDPQSSALLGEVCGRASRVELFEGHARSGDIRAANVHGTRPSWLATALDAATLDSS